MRGAPWPLSSWWRSYAELMSLAQRRVPEPVFTCQHYKCVMFSSPGAECRKRAAFRGMLADGYHRRVAIHLAYIGNKIPRKYR